MDDVIRTILAHDSIEPLGKTPGIPRLIADDDPAAQGSDLVVLRAGLAIRRKEIHLVTPPVDRSQQLHKRRLDAAAVHAHDDVQDAQRSCRGGVFRPGGIEIKCLPSLRGVAHGVH